MEKKIYVIENFIMKETYYVKLSDEQANAIDWLLDELGDDYSMYEVEEMVEEID